MSQGIVICEPSESEQGTLWAMVACRAYGDKEDILVRSITKEVHSYLHPIGG